MDWGQLARDLGGLDEVVSGSRVGRGGTVVARNAIIHMLGEELLVDAAHHAIHGVEGSETARSVLVLLRPRCAMEYAHRVLCESRDATIKSFAGSVLAHIADASALSWVEPLLESTHDAEQRAGCHLLRNLIWDHDLDVDVGPLIDLVHRHSNTDLWDMLEQAAAEYEPPG